MAHPAGGEDAEDFPSLGPVCSTCNKPDTSNMTWGDGRKYFFSNFHATPRMWPIGYILDSHYSPLRLERHFPDRNWRDAFGDLLAVEAGRDIISNEDRLAENEYASRNRYELASRDIAKANFAAQEEPELMKQVMVARQLAVNRQASHHIKMFDEYLIPHMKSFYEASVSKALETKAKFERIRTATASSLKPRGQWIASLINSGAVPTWEWATYHSITGPIMYYGKRNPPVEYFRGLIFGTPPPLPPEQVKALTDGSITQQNGLSINPDPLKAFLPSPSSIILQSAWSEPVQLAGGVVGTKVNCKNTLANGKAITKEFNQEPAKVLEEVENARKYFEMLRLGVVNLQLSKEIDEAFGNAASGDAFVRHDGGDLL